ncbi:MAG: phage minor capsid protein [Gemmiger sp.]
MALTPDQAAGIRDACEQIAEPVVEWLLQDITERVSLAGKMTSTAAYEIYRAEALGQARRALKKYLKQQLGLSNRQVRQLFRQAAKFAGEDDYRRAGKEFDFADSEIAQMAESAAKLAQADFTNLTQTMGMVAPDGKAYPLQKTYQKTMDAAFEKIFTGAQDYQSAIREATAQLAARGVLIIDYESGVHTSLEAATRRNMLGGMGLLVEQIEQKNHDELGCNGWEISAHANSAPDHEPYQGRQYSDAEFAALNGTAEHPGKLKRRIGTLNCGHIASPIILGVDSPQYKPEELAEFRRKNAEGVSFEGRHYTGYEATQMQRRLERSIRLQKRREIVAKASGDQIRLQAARTRKQILQQRYAEFSAAAGLRTQAQRLEVAGFGFKNKQAA